jgi:NADPH:quinone reductase-like Zn-dependent oxidoreductase
MSVPGSEEVVLKALVSIAPGGPETLVVQDMPNPVAGPGELLVRVKACALNYPDVLIIEDKYQFKPSRPFSPGCEFAGVVEAVGDGVAGWRVGDRVVGTAVNGGLAERIVLPAHAAFHLPAECSFIEGAALLLTYGTAIYALVDRGHVRKGDVLLVLGAAGGVGLAAVEIGKAYGARVIGAVSSEEKAAAARAAGADAVLIYPRAPFDRDQARQLAEQFKAAVGSNGADLIYDAVGGDYSEPALRAIAWEGRYLVVGFPAGIAKLPLNLILLKSCDVCGVFWGAFVTREPDAYRRQIAELLSLWGAGKIRPRVTATYPLERAGEAIAALGARQAVGKLVVTID